MSFRRRGAKFRARDLETPLTALSLRTNISWTFAGNLVYVSCQWGMLMILAKLGTPEIVGRFALGLAIAGPVMIFANLSLRQAQATDVWRGYVFGEYLTLRLLTTVVALLIISILAFVGYQLELALVILAVGLAKSFEAISDVFYGLLQQRERMDRIARSMIMKGVISLISLGSIFYLTESVFWAAMGLTVAWAAILLGYDVRSGVLMLTQSGSGTGNTGELRLRWNVQKISKLAWTVLPLGIAAGLVSFNVNIPRYMLEHYMSTREVGIFAAIAYIIIAGNVVVDALGQSSVPRLASYYADGNGQAFRSLMSKLVLLGTLLAGAGVLVSILGGSWILRLLYTPEYARYSSVLVWMMVAAGFGYVSSLLRFGVTAARYFRSQVPLLVGVTGVTAIGCAVFIPGYGVLGAALGVCIGMAFQLVGALSMLVHAERTLRKNSPVNGRS